MILKNKRKARKQPKKIKRSLSKTVLRSIVRMKAQKMMVRRKNMSSTQFLMIRSTRVYGIAI